MGSGVFPSELLFFLEGVWCFLQLLFLFGSLVVSRWSLLLFYWKCCCLNGVWCAFVVMIFLVWSIVFFRRNYCFFVGGLVFLQLSILLGCLVVVRWSLLLF